MKTGRLSYTRHDARMMKKRNTYTALTVIPKRKSALGRPRRRWETSIKAHFE